jgi:hypothetical protein
MYKGCFLGGKKCKKSSYLDLMSSSRLLEQNMILNLSYFIGWSLAKVGSFLLWMIIALPT